MQERVNDLVIDFVDCRRCRNFGFGMASFSARIGGMIAPFLLYIVSPSLSRDVNEAIHLEAKAKTRELEAKAEIEARGSRPRPRTRPK